jgi:uncharacterized protein YndB with AHSA1/START domain
MIKKLVTGLSVFLGVLIFALLLIVALSPYGRYDGFDHRLIKVSVVIQAEPAEVFTYLGNSENAADWSSFVDHITPLNADQIPDGERGAIRRCFRNKDESGERWDEEVLLVDRNKYRQLSCYNFRHFPVSAQNLQTEQRYEEIDSAITRLTFTLFYTPGKSTRIDELKMYYYGFQVAAIFKANLKNIKYEVEKEAGNKGAQA